MIPSYCTTNSEKNIESSLEETRLLSLFYIYYFSRAASLLSTVGWE